MYPEELYQLKNFTLPRELLRPISFNIARGLINDKLKFPVCRRVIQIEQYESYFFTVHKLCWWVTIKDEVLRSILMSDFTSIKKLGYLYTYIRAGGPF